MKVDIPVLHRDFVFRGQSCVTRRCYIKRAELCHKMLHQKGRATSQDVTSKGQSYVTRCYIKRAELCHKMLHQKGQSYVTRCYIKKGRATSQDVTSKGQSYVARCYIKRAELCHKMLHQKGRATSQDVTLKRAELRHTEMLHVEDRATSHGGVTCRGQSYVT